MRTIHYSPGSVKPHDHHVLCLGGLGEVVHGEGEDRAGGRRPVGVRLLPHVLDDAGGGAGAAVLLHLDTLPVEDQGGETLDEVLLGQLSLLGGVNLRNIDYWTAVTTL